ncbi:immunoglobulin-like domain-containing protein [Sporosarcina gallistercoris]|uniref:Bacterial Ig-like domain-containing protein n=1 Tax=Sporosarcina gallistercoris TaxID=2762245 RepID=A0ABR8PLS6_9BACL|nr:immunoglobulin-like domain-containing protein [Sporosarcina gallistercoris]MBD7909104.1 hypothetical protein [Sporosarcina gallistercoris]
MKRLIAISTLSIFLMGCTASKEIEVDEETKNYEGTYQDLYIQNFATVVNSGTERYGQGNVFRRHDPYRLNGAIEVYPGSVYEPDMPANLKEGYTAKITLEEVNRHAEQAKEIFSITTTNLEEAKVKIPNEPGKLYRYTVEVRDANNAVKDVRYDPLYTTFDQYNMAMKIMKDVYKKNETITFIIENWGPNYISYSKDLEVFKKKEDEWVKVVRQEDPGFVTLPLKIETAWSMSYLKLDEDGDLIMPLENRSIVLDRYEWEEGQYKLKIQVGSAKHPYTLEDTFRVE